MGVIRPEEGHLLHHRVPRDSNRMSHPLAGAQNHGGGVKDSGLRILLL